MRQVSDGLSVLLLSILRDIRHHAAIACRKGRLALCAECSDISDIALSSDDLIAVNVELRDRDR